MHVALDCVEFRAERPLLEALNAGSIACRELTRENLVWAVVGSSAV